MHSVWKEFHRRIDSHSSSAHTLRRKTI